MVLNSPIGEQLWYIVYLFFQASNNVAEYERLVTGLTLVLSLGVRELLWPATVLFMLKSTLYYHISSMLPSSWPGQQNHGRCD